MTKKTLAIAGIAVLFALTGCSTSPEITPAAPESTATSGAVVEEQEEAAPEFDGVAAFGETATYPDGVAITVNMTSEYTPSEYAAGAEGGVPVKFTVTINNGSDEKFDPTAFPTVTSGGSQSASIADTEQNIGLPPTGTLLPGDTITWDVASAVADPADIKFQIAPSFMYEDVIFTNR